MLVTERPDMFWGLIASMLIGNVILLVLNLPLVGLFVSILRTPLSLSGAGRAGDLHDRRLLRCAAPASISW